jgi:hypothetical protein
MSDIIKYIQQYYVYECRVDGILKYIGMGKGKRLNHCNSGKSHVSELNKDFHEGKTMEVVKIKEGLTKSQALQYEWEQITLAEGLYNKRKDIDYTSIADIKRSTQYKVLASMSDPKTKPKLLKLLGNKAEEMTDEKYRKMRKDLGSMGLDMYLVQYEGANPIIILDRAECSNYEIYHLGCPHYPNCFQVGDCGREI